MLTSAPSLGFGRTWRDHPADPAFGRIAGGGRTEHLELQVELIAPEVRHGGRHTFSAGDVGGHDRGLPWGEFAEAMRARAPRAIVNDGFATDDTDAVIWEGELSAVRVGIRRNGHQFRLNVDNHASFTTIEQGVFTVGPRNFTTDKQARMAELIVFREDVRDTDAIRSTRASAAGAYLLGVDTELSDSGVSDPAVSSEQTSEPPASESHGSHTSEPHSSHTSEPPGGSSEGGSEPPGGSSESDVSEPPPVDAPPIQCVVVTI